MIATPPGSRAETDEHHAKDHLDDARRGMSVRMKGRQRAFPGAVAQREDDDQRDVPTHEKTDALTLGFPTRQQGKKGDQRAGRHGGEQAETHDGEKKSCHLPAQSKATLVRKASDIPVAIRSPTSDT